MSRSLWRGVSQQLRSSAQRAVTTERVSIGRCYSSSTMRQQPFLRGDGILRRADGCRRHHWRRDANTIVHSPQSFTRSRRRFSSTPHTQHGHIDPPKPGEELKITFIDKEGESHTFEVAKGDNLLDIAQANELEMEGACGGSCACSTCHVIVEDSDMYDKMAEPDDDENDMLDLAFGLTETSRLGCQVKMAPELDGLVVKLPSMTRNMQASDFAEKKKA